MFHIPCDHNESVVIQGQEIFIPKPGMIYDRFQGRGWVECDIENWGTAVKEDQYWRRTGMPEWYKTKRRAEAREQRHNPTFFDEECEEFRIREWEKRINGFWFLNKGEPIYISGLNWWFLEHIWISAEVNNGYPLFTKPDRDVFLLLQFCRDDPNTLGLDLMAGRRKGKTAKSVAFLLERVTRMKNTRAGIQSKTDDDARDVVYKEGVWNAFKNLPHYFKPKYKKARQRNAIPPELVFRDESPGVDEDEFKPDDGLSSTLDYRSSNELAYDGAKLIDYVADEERKTFHVDVRERRRVVKKCLTNFDGEWGESTYFGCTTVEFIETRPDHNERVVEMWKESDQLARNPETGQTPSGLIHYLLRGDIARNFDKYGDTDEERNRKIILAQRPDPNKDLMAYYSEVRKDPLNEAECFRSVGKECHFDAVKINNRLDELTWRDDIKIIRGRLRWVNNKKPGMQEDGSFFKDAKVEFVPDSAGPFYLRHDIPEHMKNNVSWHGRIPIPENRRKFSMGVDPYDHDVVREGHKSKGAAWLYGRRLLGDPSLEDKFLMLYWDRPSKSSIFYENCWKMAWLAGTDFLYESNRDKIKGFFEHHGMLSLLETLHGRKEPGIAASSRSKVDLVEAMADYITDNCDKIDFSMLLDDALVFDINDTRKYDLTMAAGWTKFSDLFQFYYTAHSDKTASKKKKYFRRYKVGNATRTIGSTNVNNDLWGRHN